MELFRVAGLSSEDLMRPGQASPKAFLGTMFKLAPPKEIAPEPEAPILSRAELEALQEKAAMKPKDGDDKGPADGQPNHWTAAELKAMTKDKLVELGGALGVADLSGTKDKLIEAILATQ